MALVTRADKVDSKRIFDGYIISVRQDTLKLSETTFVTREVVEHNGGVVIACQPADGQIILIKQYRYPLDRYILELPAGRIEKNEDPLVCAQRELIEETGFQANSWQEISRFYSAPGFCDELLYLYRARGISFTGKNLDIDEETEVLTLPLNRAWEMAVSGEINDAKTIAGLALLRN